MSRNIKKITLTMSFQVIGLILGLFTVLAPKISAQASQRLVTGDTIACATNSPSYYDTLSQPVSGAIYARFPNGINPSVVYLYSENTSNASCLLLGAAKIESGHWLFLGNGNSVTNIMIQTPDLKAQPNAASVIDLLAVPSSAICAPVVYCNLNYQGDLGYLVPNTIHDTAQQMTVYEANSIVDVRFTGIDYYADGKLLYSSTQLRPINHNYLAGGKHKVFIQVNFTNGEKVNINQVVNMGIDWTGALKLRSSFYKSHNKTVFIIVSILILGLVVAGLWKVWRVYYKRREFKIDHGVDEYEGQDMIDPTNKPSDTGPPVV